MKRLLTFVLAAVLVLSLLPLGLVPASAVSEQKASQEMVDILKKLEGFSAKPYWDNRQYTVGYGTRPLNQADLDRYLKDGISKEEAETLLVHYLEEMGSELNKFADKNGLSFTQGQFDCLLSLSFNCGTRWMYEESTLRTAILEQKTGNDFLFAIGQWSTSAGVTQRGLVRRRLIEANMYLNNTYSMTVPENYSYVVHDNNGGEAEIKVQAYDSNTPAEILSVPTREGYYFVGWFTQAQGGEQVKTLDASVRNATIYAQWGEGEAPKPEEPKPEEPKPEEPKPEEPKPEEPKPEEPTGTAITVTATDVNIRKGPGTNYAVVGKANTGDKLTITETAEGTGYTWGKSEKGWIVLKYTDYSATAPEEPETPDVTPPTGENKTVKGTITGDSLRIRKGPGTGYEILGLLNKGDRVEILEQKTVGSMVWGRISKGWISMNYFKADPEEQPEEKPEEKPETPEKVMGTITGMSLRIRKGAGTSYDIVGFLNTGDRVEILETKTAGTMVWGRISKGWISMDYVKLDNAEATQKIPAAVQNGVTLRVRQGAGESYAVTSYLSGGTKVTILETRTVSGTTWARIEQGWVLKDYLVVEGSEDQKPEASVIRGTVTADILNVRSGAGLSNKIVGRLYEGAKVEILETKTVGSMTWGRVQNGWISMDYVKKN